MAEYIERKSLMENIRETVLFTVRENEKMPTTQMRGANKVIDRILRAPTADVVEVRHGRWIDDSIPMHTGSYFKCSVCEGHDDQEYDYCHHCGAKMDGKDGAE